MGRFQDPLSCKNLGHRWREHYLSTSRLKGIEYCARCNATQAKEHAYRGSSRGDQSWVHHSREVFTVAQIRQHLEEEREDRKEHPERGSARFLLETLVRQAEREHGSTKADDDWVSDL